MTSVEDKILSTITRPSERDEQVRAGPSSLATTCAYCLARSLLHDEEDEGYFNLAAWIGTCVHEWLENHEEDPTILVERKLVIGEAGEYGTIKGTSDRYDTEHHTVVDYKTTKVAKIKAYKQGMMQQGDRLIFLNTTLEQHYKQACLYAYGVPEPVDRVGIFYIARDGWKLNSDTVWYVEYPYSEDVAKQALAMAGDVYEYAREYGADDIESDPECFRCSLTGRV